MDGRYLKDKKSGLIVDTQADYNKYIQEKRNLKDVLNTKNELRNAKTEIGNLRTDMNEIKDLLKQLINKEQK